MRRSLLFIFSLLLTACTAAVSSTPSPNSTQKITPTENSTFTTSVTLTPDVTPYPTNIRVDDESVYEVPHMLGFDGIRPIYDPEFTLAQQAPLRDEELIMGVSFEGQAKAYPVTVLRTREMVIDDLAGRYILVSW